MAMTKVNVQGTHLIKPLTYPRHIYGIIGQS